VLVGASFGLGASELGSCGLRVDGLFLKWVPTSLCQDERRVQSKFSFAQAPGHQGA